MYTRICKICGKEFQTNRPNKSVCDAAHVRKCVICGTEFEITNSSITKQTCSRKCANELISRKTSEDSIIEKRKQTNLNRYGVEHAAQSDEIKQKTVQTNLKKYGVIHSSKLKETQDKKRKTNNERYGVDCVFQSDTIKNKIKKKLIEEYGVENPGQGAEIRQKVEQTNLNHLGVRNPMMNENVKSKVKKTNLQRYGSECVLASEAIHQKVAETNKKNLGVEYPFQSKEIQNKIHGIIKEKYGVAHPIQNPDVFDKMKETCKKRYGGFTMENEDLKKQVYETNEKVWGTKYPSQTDEVKRRISETCKERYGVNWPCQKVEPSDYNRISKINQEFSRLLDENNIPYEMEYPLENYSYDFRIKLGKGRTFIEIDPSITHNSLFSVFDKNSRGLDKEYHQRKSQFAKELGFHCIHVFDWDDWNSIIDVIKAKESIYARKCMVQEIDNRTCNLFEDKYHLQGKCNKQTYRYGLYYRGELVEVMTFGKPRYNKQYEYEVLRLCTSSKYKVIGGASKLFHHFITQMNPSSIISYCDKAKFSGYVYEAIGMAHIRDTQPSEIWSRGKEKVTTRLLLARGYDQLFNAHYGKGTDNRELMKNDGWLPVFDCGQSVYEWKRM